MAPDYYGLPVRRIANRHVQIDFLTGAGPRLVRLLVRGTETNLFAEVPAKSVDTAYGRYYFRGGHRLWHSPEALPRTYATDNEGVVVEESEGRVRLIQPAEANTRIGKEIEIALDPERPRVTLQHRLTNEGPWLVELAAWAITMLRTGGWAVAPQQTTALDEAGLLSNRHLVLWPYTRVQDPRLHLRDDVVVLHGQARLPPFKFGYLNRAGWLGYFVDGIFFLKRFTPQPALPHVDVACNSEIYCNDEFLELETLSPLLRLAPGETLAHTETWEITTGVEMPASAEEIPGRLDKLLA